MKKLFLFSTLALLLAVSLSGCLGAIPKVAVIFDFQADEVWTVTMEMHIAESMFALMQGELTQSFDVESLGEELPEGVEYSYDISELNDEGNYVFSLFIDGQGYDKFLETFEEGVYLEENDDQLSIRLESDFAADFQDATTTTEIVITGGRIIETNGDKEDDFTAVWTNPTGELTATIGILPKVSVNIELKSGETWTVVIDKYIPENLYDEIGDDLESSFEDILNSDDFPEGIEYRYEVTEPENGKEFVASFIVEGKGYNTLNQVFDDSIIRESDGNLVFKFDPKIFEMLGDLTMDTELVLTGGNIVNTNGSEEDSKTVIWKNPNPNDELTTEMKKPSFLADNLLYICGGLLLMGLCLLVIGVIVFLILRQNKKNKEKQV